MKKIQENKEYIIVEIIPTNPNPNIGEIVQISALKLKGLKIIDRFDYRLNLNKILIPDLIRILDYDIDKFNYLESGKDILDKFICWSENINLLIIDNKYTKDYLKDLSNKKESIFKYLNSKYSDDIIEKIIEKYNLQPSNYIVDLLYEALIYESNKNGSLSSSVGGTKN